MLTVGSNLEEERTDCACHYRTHRESIIESGIDPQLIFNPNCTRQRNSVESDWEPTFDEQGLSELCAKEGNGNWVFSYL